MRLQINRWTQPLAEVVVKRKVKVHVCVQVTHRFESLTSHFLGRAESDRKVSLCHSHSPSGVSNDSSNIPTSFRLFTSLRPFLEAFIQL